MLSVGAVIWVSLRPLIRLIICVGCGVVITKADIFPPIAARGASQITLNIALPCLMFSKIVPAFNPSNVAALGPLVLVALLYEAIGIAIAWVIKQFFWTPHRFRYGILCAGGWGNYGDIPTSVIMSITGAAPFGAGDQTLSVAYISAFLLVFFITLFPLGGNRLIAMDFVGPEVEDEEVREAMRMKRRNFFHGLVHPVTGLQRVFWQRRPSVSDDLEQFDEKHRVDEKAQGKEKQENEERRPGLTDLGKHVSFYHDDATTIVPTEGVSQFCSPAPTEPIVISSREASPDPMRQRLSLSPPELPATASAPSPPPPTWPHRHPHLAASFRHAKTFLTSLISPASVAILVAFPIALVPTLKALFVPVSGTYIHAAPDGQPPLAFIMDSTSFIGAASVPLGLICLGSALARLKVPWGQWGALPLGAISALAVGKIIIMPVLGVLITEGLVHAGVIAKEDKVLRFVCIFFSCLPTATTQVFLTQVYSGTGSADSLSAFLIPQYILMLLSMTALTAYSLQLLF